MCDSTMSIHSSSSGNNNSSSSGNNNSSRSGNNNSRSSTSKNSDIDGQFIDCRSSGRSQVNCIICLESYRAVDNICGGSCGHVFHWKCLKSWKQNSEECPTCRSASSKFFPIYLNFEEAEVESESISSQRSQSVEYENMLYESALYRDEIKYLNSVIKALELKQNPLESSSSSDSD